MVDWMWDVLLFALGFAAGLGAAGAAVLGVRLRREAAAEGRQLVDRLGPLASRRFLAALSE